MEDFSLTELIKKFFSHDHNGRNTDKVDFENLKNNNAVLLTGNQTVAGVKTFSSFPVTPSSAPTTDYQTANKKFVDDSVADLATEAYANSVVIKAVSGTTARLTVTNHEYLSTPFYFRMLIPGTVSVKVRVKVSEVQTLAAYEYFPSNSGDGTFDHSINLYTASVSEETYTYYTFDLNVRAGSVIALYGHNIQCSEISIRFNTEIKTALADYVEEI